MNFELLVLSLQTAVPLIVADLATLEPEERDRKILRHSWRPASIEAICSHGDQLLYDGRHCASTFNHLAQALAALSHCPGGVTAFGINWCAEHHPGGRATTGDFRCVECGDTPPLPEPRTVEDVPLPDPVA